MAQLTYEQCVQLQEYIWVCGHKWLRFTQEDAAQYIWSVQPTVSRELKRCRLLEIPYNAGIAHKQRSDIRLNTNNDIHNKILLGSELDIYIKDKLTVACRSPEQIAWIRGVEYPNQKVAYQTIYSYIYEHYPELVQKHFKRHGKKYNYWKIRTRNKIPNRVSIHHRPIEVEAKERLWDFEGDTIVWSNTWDRIVTCNDRKSGMLFADIILQQNEQRLAIATSTAMMLQLKDIDRCKLKTITFDNWVEFFDHEYLKEMLGIDTFFADPYSSWQRWANENTNGLLRFFFPKWTDFKMIDLNYFKHVVQLINNRPRKRLWWKTPMEVFYV